MDVPVNKMSEELKPDRSKASGSENQATKLPTEEISEPETTKLPSAAKPETKPTESPKITNEKELSREQKTAVKKLKDYSREAKKRSNAKQNEQTEADNNSERAEQNGDEREEIKTEKPEISINTFLAFGGVLIALAGLYLAHKNYLINQIKAGVHDDMIKIQPTPATPQQKEKKNPKFRTL